MTGSSVAASERARRRKRSSSMHRVSPRHRRRRHTPATHQTLREETGAQHPPRPKLFGKDPAPHATPVPNCLGRIPRLTPPPSQTVWEGSRASRHPRPELFGRKGARLRCALVTVDLARLDATAQAALVRAGTVSARELVDAAIEPMEQGDG